MKQTVQTKTSQNATAANQQTSVGANGASIAPPSYGMDFLDSQAKQPNRTGLPDNLKSGIENLSGFSMDSVRVHYNSPKPAQLNALAYTQGTNIHVAPGQEQHLPHEAWHVVQQAQGRVKPTMQMKGSVSVNDDEGLESEADMMGDKAVHMKVGMDVIRIDPPPSNGSKPSTLDLGLSSPVSLVVRNSETLQLAGDYSGLLPGHETYADSYTFGGNKKTDFTYHHIIPENKLQSAVVKLKKILKDGNLNTEDGQRLKTGVDRLQNNAHEQWLSTRAKNLTFAINKEFSDLNVAVDESTIKSILKENESLEPLFMALKNLILKRLSERFSIEKSKLRKQISDLLKDPVFINRWDNGNVQGDLNPIIQSLTVDGNKIFDTQEVVNIFQSIKSKDLISKGSNKGKLVEAIESYTNEKTFEKFCQKFYEPIIINSVSRSSYLKKIISDKGLPRENQDKLEDAVVWNPGNIHRGPKSDLRFNPNNQGFDALLDDGGNAFEIAAVNIVSQGHFEVLDSLNKNLDVLLQDASDPPSLEVVCLAAGIASQMTTIQQMGLTKFDERQWGEIQIGNKNIMRLVQNNLNVIAASANKEVANLGRTNGIQGI